MEHTATLHITRILLEKGKDNLLVRRECEIDQNVGKGQRGRRPNYSFYYYLGFHIYIYIIAYFVHGMFLHGQKMLLSSVRCASMCVWVVV